MTRRFFNWMRVGLADAGSTPFSGLFTWRASVSAVFALTGFRSEPSVAFDQSVKFGFAAETG
jgi:hypothetical protein